MSRDRQSILRYDRGPCADTSPNGIPGNKWLPITKSLAHAHNSRPRDDIAPAAIIRRRRSSDRAGHLRPHARGVSAGIAPGSICRRITQGDYDKKARALKERLTEIALQIERRHGGKERLSNHLGNLDFRDFASSRDFCASNAEQKREVINFVFSNLKLGGRKLEYSLRSPFDLLVDREGYAGWLAFLNTVRTERFTDILALRSILSPITRAGEVWPNAGVYS